mgnify:FL=1
MDPLQDICPAERILFFIQDTNGIQHADHGNASICKYGHPHVGMSGKTKDHNCDLDHQGKYYVLPCNTVCARAMAMD